MDEPVIKSLQILVINPNTSLGMTQAIGRAAQAASRIARIQAVQPSFGPESIESFYDEAFAHAGVAEQAMLASRRPAPPDATIIACFGDPGLDAAREVLNTPVMGIAEAAFHMASSLSSSFSVITTLTRTCRMTEHLLVKYGFERTCRGVHGTDIPVLALEDASAEVLQCLEDAALRALRSDNSHAIVLGCAGMASMCERLSQRLGVPVIDGVAAAVMLCEAWTGRGSPASKTGGYAYPLPKTYTGWAQHLAP
jgi:allantoin racemase